MDCGNDRDIKREWTLSKQNRQMTGAPCPQDQFSVLLLPIFPQGGVVEV